MTAWIGLAGAGVAGIIVVGMSASGIREEAVRQGSARARQLAVLVRAPIADGAPERAAALLHTLAEAPDVLEASLVHGAQSHSSRPEGLLPESERVLGAALETGELQVFRPGSDEAGDAAMWISVPVAGEAGSAVALRLSTAGLADARRELIVYNLASALIGVVVMCAAAWWLLGWLLRPVDEVEQAVAALASGSRGRLLEPERLGALAPVARAVNRLADSSGAIDVRLGAMAGRLQTLVDRVAQAAAELGGEIDEQRRAVDAATTRLGESEGSIERVEGEIDGVSGAAGAASNALERLDAALERVSGNMYALAERVDTSSAASHQMNASIREVSEISGRVQEAAGDTTESVALIDDAIRRVVEAVREATDRSRAVHEDAESGESAVRGMIEGGDETRERAAEARRIYERLGERIVEIGDVSLSIAAINEETNLLALNASIVAARAGESGRPFAVVAERVKTLAAQTAASMSQIERQVGALKQDSDAAAGALDAALEAVERGARRARSAGVAFDRIRSSSTQATERIDEISVLALGQAQSSDRVARAARSTQAQVEAIGEALKEQTQTGRDTLEASDAARELCQKARDSAREEREVGHAASASIAAVDERMRSIRESIALHSQTSREVSATVTKAFSTTERGAERMQELVDAAESLSRDWEQMRREFAERYAGAQSGGEGAAG